MPILQSFLLQETFTIDKKQKLYLLETKVLINGVEETVQTLTLGYQPENPFVSYTRIYFNLAYQKSQQLNDLMHVSYVPCISSPTFFRFVLA